MHIHIDPRAKVQLIAIDNSPRNVDYGNFCIDYGNRLCLYGMDVNVGAVALSLSMPSSWRTMRKFDQEVRLFLIISL